MDQRGETERALEAAQGQSASPPAAPSRPSTSGWRSGKQSFTPAWTTFSPCERPCGEQTRRSGRRGWRSVVLGLTSLPRPSCRPTRLRATCWSASPSPPSSTPPRRCTSLIQAPEAASLSWVAITGSLPQHGRRATRRRLCVADGLHRAPHRRCAWDAGPWLTAAIVSGHHMPHEPDIPTRCRGPDGFPSRIRLRAGQAVTNHRIRDAREPQGQGAGSDVGPPVVDTPLPQASVADIG